MSRGGREPRRFATRSRPALIKSWVARAERMPQMAEQHQGPLRRYFRKPLLELRQGNQQAAGKVTIGTLVSNGDGWMAMIKARNQLSHTCNLEQAQSIARDVIERFAPLFTALRHRFTRLSDEPS